jgi:carboxypeptidase PM20D1
MMNNSRVNAPVAALLLAGMLLSASPSAGEAGAGQSSADYPAAHQRQALEVYRTAISYRTAESHGQVPALASYLAEQFVTGGFAPNDVHVLPLTLPSGEETASLVVRYRGSGAAGAGPILLMAHMDVVDALPRDWERDPFTLIEEDGYFFGRGTFDDKFGVTMLTSTFLRLKREGFVPKRDLVIAFTGDEETGMLTTRALVTTHRHLTDAAFALNADAGGGVLDEDGTPLYYLVQTAEKTYASFDLTITNPGGHSSAPRADNAVYELADVLKKVQAHRFPVQVNDATRRYFEHASQFTAGAPGEAMSRLARNAGDEAAAEVLWHHPEHVGITRTTCVATMLRAGHAENALPQSATATINCRIFPGVEVGEIERTLREVAGNPALRIEVLGDPRASPASPVDDDLMRAIGVAVATIRPGTALIPYMAPYGTDGIETRRAGIPTYGVTGLFMKNSDQFAHGLNERVPVRSFYDGLDYWYALIMALAGPAS